MNSSSAYYLLTIITKFKYLKTVATMPELHTKLSALLDLSPHPTITRSLKESTRDTTASVASAVRNSEVKHATEHYDVGMPLT